MDETVEEIENTGSQTRSQRHRLSHLFNANDKVLQSIALEAKKNTKSSRSRTLKKEGWKKTKKLSGYDNLEDSFAYRPQSTRIERPSKSHYENSEIPSITNEYISTENESVPKLTKNKRKKKPVVIFSSSDEEKQEPQEKHLDAKIKNIKERLKRRRNAKVLAPDTPELDRKRGRKVFAEVQVVSETDDEMPELEKKIDEL